MLAANQELNVTACIFWFLIVSLTLGCSLPEALQCQTAKPKSAPLKRTVVTKRAVVGNARIELTATAPRSNGSSTPVVRREFFLLAVDPAVLRSQIEKEIPLPESKPQAPASSSGFEKQALEDAHTVSDEFKVSPGFVQLAQKAPQTGKIYQDDPKFRRLEDYAQVDELKKMFDSLVRKKIKKKTASSFSENQKLDLIAALETEFDRLPPADKTSIPIRLAQLMAEREALAFQQRRSQIEQRKIALEQRAKRWDELIAELEKAKKAFRASSDAKGVIRFSKLLPGNYWAYAENFTFEGMTASWNVPINLRRNNDVKRVELTLGNR
jgi:hypothetical protein